MTNTISKINDPKQNNLVHSLTKLYSGKVRDLYAIDENKMLMVASDRLSTFDIILNQPIPNKGVYLTQISLFWFNYLKDIMPNHLIDATLDTLTAQISKDELSYLQGRACVVKRVTPLPIEIIVRGYMAGSGYKDYLANGTICGIKLPSGLHNAQKLPQAIFTPSTKATIGNHDENITLQQCQNLLGKELTARIEQLALQLYHKACDKAHSCGIIIADTKFEFGLDGDNNLLLIDEVLTPDSSRFWDATTYQVGSNPLSFDKQFVRDYLQLDIKWNKHPPIPNLPPQIIEKTVAKYAEIANRLGIKI